MKLENKVAIVTGAASGMGKAIAIRYAREGAKVVVSDIDLKGAGETAAEIEAFGGSAAVVYTDVAKEKNIRDMIDTAVNNYGTVDILVNNAGIMDSFVPAAEITDELWDRVFAVNVTGPMRAIRKVLPVFLEKGKGIIINIASVGGLNGSRAGAAYTASKHAVIGLSKNIGFQYAKSGIRCNVIAPGAVNTNIGASMKNINKFGMDKAMEGITSNPRTGEPDEIAGQHYFWHRMIQAS